MASVRETLQQINSSLSSAGGHYRGYSCKTVSWDDVQRGTTGSFLSCWGSNITDTRLWAKDGRSLFTVRSDNWNERLGKVTADDIAVVASGACNENELQPCTLRTFLKSPARFGSYTGIQDPQLDLSDEILDQKISIRFQTTFLPVDDSERASIEFAPEVYNYNTRSDTNPRNLILLCTTQGLAIQQDGAGAKKLFHQSVLPSGAIGRYWLEAERSRHQVGGAQKETKEERDDALKRGKASASVIGVKGMGTCFNALMTIQVPLVQQQVASASLQPSLGMVPKTVKKPSISLTSCTLNLSLSLAGGVLALSSKVLNGALGFASGSGKAKKATTTTTGSVASVTTIVELRSAIKTQEKREEHILKKVDQMVGEAKAKMSMGDKKGALFAMERKKAYELEADKIQNVKMTLETQIINLESAAQNTATFDAMKAGSAPMKKMRNEVGVGKTDDIMDEMKEEMEMTQEVDFAISESSNPLMCEEYDLLAELEGLETADLEAELLKPPSKPVQEEVYPNLDAKELNDLKKLEAELEKLGSPSPMQEGNQRPEPKPKVFGSSHAARVSKGSLVDTKPKGGILSVTEPRRHFSEHITVTVVMYYVCSGGVPTANDVKAAVDDLEDLYQSVESAGHLADAFFAFMKSNLTAKDVNDIHEKCTTQPPPSPAPVHWDVFPCS